MTVVTQLSRSKISARKWLAALPLALLTSGCDWVVMSPSGDIAVQQRDLVLISTGLMLLIIIPVIAMTLFFAFRYRQSNKAAKYEPNWDHSVGLELLIWGIPLLIIIALGALTWTSTHLLDPYRPLGRISAQTSDVGENAPIGQLSDNQQTITGGKPLDVQVVALDWKWLFIYPEYGIATVNELAAPVDRPLRFKMTSSSVMNAFYIPALAGMIYTMPGMQTTLNAVINKPGNYEGFSSNYSGAGFSGMRFRFHGVSDAGFQAWVNRVKQGGAKASGGLNRASYLQLEKPSEKVPVRYYNAVAPDMFKLVVEQCVQPGKVCMSQMMHGGKSGGDSHAGMAMPGVNGGKGPQDSSERVEGALMKDADEKGSGNHWTAPADIKRDGANSAPGSQSNRNHTMLSPSTMPGTRPVANG